MRFIDNFLIISLMLFPLSTYANVIEADFDDDEQADYVECRFVGEAGSEGAGRLYCWSIATTLGAMQELEIPFLEDVSSIHIANGILFIEASSPRCDYKVSFSWHAKVGWILVESKELDCWR